MEDEEKEDVHVGKGTYKRIYEMAGGFKVLALLICAQLAIDSLEYLNQRVKNKWSSEDG